MDQVPGARGRGQGTETRPTSWSAASSSRRYQERRPRLAQWPSRTRGRAPGSRFCLPRLEWGGEKPDEHRGKPEGRMIYRVRSPRPSATNSGAARRCRRDLLQSSAQPTGCSPSSSTLPVGAARSRRTFVRFVASWRAAGKLRARATVFLHFRRNMNTPTGRHRKGARIFARRRRSLGREAEPSFRGR
jgi:hypothetical protein